jgi:hypothetical protein
MNQLHVQRASELSIDSASLTHWLVQGLWSNQAVGILGGEPNAARASWRWTWPSVSPQGLPVCDALLSGAFLLWGVTVCEPDVQNGRRETHLTISD